MLIYLLKLKLTSEDHRRHRILTSKDLFKVDPQRDDDGIGGSHPTLPVRNYSGFVDLMVGSNIWIPT